MKAWQLIEKGWTQGASARDSYGIGVYSGDPDAICWCAIGALAAVYGDSQDEYDQAFRRVVGVLTDRLGCVYPVIMQWNDAPGRTQAEVVALLKEADV